jgi:hypothetical protein
MFLLSCMRRTFPRNFLAGTRLITLGNSLTKSPRLFGSASSFEASHEQQKIVDAVKSGKNVVVNAVAGRYFCLGISSDSGSH